MACDDYFSTTILHQMYWYVVVSTSTVSTRI